MPTAPWLLKTYGEKSCSPHIYSDYHFCQNKGNKYEQALNLYKLRILGKILLKLKFYFWRIVKSSLDPRIKICKGFLGGPFHVEGIVQKNFDDEP